MTVTDKEVMQMALEALAQSWVNDHHGNRKQVLAMCADDFEKPFQAMLALRKRLAQCDRCGKASPAEIHTCTPKQEPVAHSVIAGALFDFMGWLTSRKERIVLSSADNASPAVEVITEFAKMRGLSLDDAKVQDWNTTPPQHWSDCAVHSEPAEIHTCTPRESGCAECGKKASEGWALYCVECSKPMREWIELTDEERLEIIAVGGEAAVLYVTEAKLKEKNT